MRITSNNSKAYTDALWRAAEAAGFTTNGAYTAEMIRLNRGQKKFAVIPSSDERSEIAIVLPSGKNERGLEFDQPKSLSVRFYYSTGYKIMAPHEAIKVELPGGFFLSENTTRFDALVEALKAAVAELRPQMEAYVAARANGAAAAAARKEKQGRFNDIIRAEMEMPMLEAGAFLSDGEIGGFQPKAIFKGEADKLIELARAIKAKAAELGVKIETGY